MRELSLDELQMAGGGQSIIHNVIDLFADVTMTGGAMAGAAGGACVGGPAGAAIGSLALGFVCWVAPEILKLFV
ncbi:hypothetical protein ACFQU1_14055 [Chelatococcus sp. GCM10030263]|uniref:hypothetical protein n=1 Tax=Chelatococcus sp. GCM10030263 TaxID=3273387 RepID=UPI003619C438